MTIKVKVYFQIIGIFFMLCALGAANASADVSIYAEGDYTESDLAVYIYADISESTQLRGAGVKLTYDTSELTVENAEKNTSVWNLANESYVLPDCGTDGEVVIILGKLDMAAPAEGVTGNKILLGKVRFNRAETAMPFSPTLGLTLGKESPFSNFVDVDQTVLDESIVFDGITVAERVLESPACMGAKLKAAKTLCKTLMNCSAKSIQKADQSVCFEKAGAKFEAAWEKAEAKADGACQTASMADMADRIGSAVEDMFEKISDGISTGNKDAGRLGQALLKTAQMRCVGLLDAEIANFKKSDPEKLKTAITKVDDRFQKGWSKAKAKADKKQVAYTGASDSEIKEIIDDLIIEILSGMGL